MFSFAICSFPEVPLSTPKLAKLLAEKKRLFALLQSCLPYHSHVPNRNSISFCTKAVQLEKLTKRSYYFSLAGVSRSVTVTAAYILSVTNLNHQVCAIVAVAVYRSPRLR